MGKVIVFSGIDGSGKSAHARKLAHELRASGKSVKYVWMRGRGRVFFSLLLLASCRVLGITRVRKLKNGMKVSEYPFYAYAPLRLLWPWLQLVDSLIYSAVLVHLSSWHSNFTLIERSVIDTFVDVFADVHNPLLFGSLHKLFLSLLPENSLVIVFDVDEEIAMIRKGDTPQIDYLRLRRRLYRSLQRGYGWPIVSTESDFELVHNLLLKIIRNAKIFSDVE